MFRSGRRRPAGRGAGARTRRHAARGDDAPTVGMGERAEVVELGVEHGRAAVGQPLGDRRRQAGGTARRRPAPATTTGCGDRWQAIRDAGVVPGRCERRRLELRLAHRTTGPSGSSGSTGANPPCDVRVDGGAGRTRSSAASTRSSAIAASDESNGGRRRRAPTASGLLSGSTSPSVGRNDDRLEQHQRAEQPGLALGGHQQRGSTHRVAEADDSRRPTAADRPATRLPPRHRRRSPASRPSQPAAPGSRRGHGGRAPTRRTDRRAPRPRRGRRDRGTPWRGRRAVARLPDRRPDGGRRPRPRPRKRRSRARRDRGIAVVSDASVRSWRRRHHIETQPVEHDAEHDGRRDARPRAVS